MAKIVYARQGDKLVKKWRCTRGPRKGRLMSSPQACFAPINIKQRARMRALQRSKGSAMSRRANITKKTNALSKQVSRLNKLIQDHIERDSNGRK